MTILLNDAEARILGALIEKEITTPEYYPLSLNALVNACNQKSNRDPVMNIDEDAARTALHGLDQQCLVRAVSASDSRVTKYEHRFQEALNLGRQDTAILCELLLRGPQTPGELRSRAERMHHFDDLGTVQTVLQRLMRHEPPLVSVLPRQPGTKEARYAQLLCGEGEMTPTPAEASAESLPNHPAKPDRVTELAEEVASLKEDVAALQRQFAAFRKQFE